MKNNWYKEALNQKAISDVSENWEPRFSDIFGDKKRILIPLENKWLADIRKKLENGETKSKTKYKISDDYSMAIMQKIKRDGSPDNRAISMGRVIGSELGQEYMNEWARQWETISKNKSENFSIILSIDPIDIARMSDHEGIESCHSEGGIYFSCALEEAKSGGGVAYVIPSDELKKIKIEDLNAEGKELFLDETRHNLDEYEGKIKPISRIRINRYVEGDGDGEVAIPVNVHYGEYIPDFYSTVRDFLIKKQEAKIPDLEDNIENYKRTGGSYIDKNDSSIIKECFGHDMGVKGNLVNENSLNQQRQQWQTETETAMSDFNDEHDLAEVYASVDLDGESLNLYGGFKVTFNVKIKKSNGLNENENVILEEIKKLFHWKTNNSILKFAGSDIDIEGEFSGKIYTIELKCHFDDIYNPDAFSGACDDLKTWMKNEYNICLESMLQIFVKYGCYEQEHVTPHLNTNLRREVSGLLSENGLLVCVGNMNEFSTLGEVEHSELCSAFVKTFRDLMNRKEQISNQINFDFYNKFQPVTYEETPLIEMRINDQKSFKSTFVRFFYMNYAHGPVVNIYFRIPTYFYHEYGHDYFLHVSRIWDNISSTYKNEVNRILKQKDDELKAKEKTRVSNSIKSWYGY